jgi:hypothetical protein
MSRTYMFINSPFEHGDVELAVSFHQ